MDREDREDSEKHRRIASAEGKLSLFTFVLRWSLSLSENSFIGKFSRSALRSFNSTILNLVLLLPTKCIFSVRIFGKTENI